MIHCKICSQTIDFDRPHGSIWFFGNKPDRVGKWICEGCTNQAERDLEKEEFKLFYTKYGSDRTD